MDRLAKLRHRSSVGLNSSSTSSVTGVGYETANDESITSGCSMYFSMTEGDVAVSPLDEDKLDCLKEDQTLSCSHVTVEVTDQTLQNDFSVEEVSTIRKVTIAQASPATVEVASQMSVKYMGVSSTPARALRSAQKVKPTTPASSKKDLSGFAELNQTADKKSNSIMRKMREPKLSECSSAEEGEDSRITLDSSVQSAVGIERAAAQASNKSYGTNVLSNFFASLNVNKSSPLVPEIKVDKVGEENGDRTPSKKRDSNSLQNFFESLKKDPVPDQEKENKPRTVERRKSVRKSLIPKVPGERLQTRNSILTSASENRVASPIAKPAKKTNLVKMIPEKLKQMRKAAQSDLVSVKRKSVIPAPTARSMAANSKITETEKTVVNSKIEEIKEVNASEQNEDIVGDCLKVGVAKAVTAERKTTPKISKIRKSIMPTAAVSRRSVVPPKTLRRSVAPTTFSVQSKVALRVPAKTTLANSESSRRNSLGKRPSIVVKCERNEQPLAKLRKSLAPVKEAATIEPPAIKEATKPAPSRIRPPAANGAITFKKPDTFTCEFCQRSFRLKLTLEGHKKSFHPNGANSPSSKADTSGGSKSTDTTKCRYCAKSFASAKILSNHLTSNCLKIPVLEKRKLLAQDEQQRSITAKSFTPPATSNDASTRGRRPSASAAGTRPKLSDSDRSNSSNRSVDGVANSDTSTSSSIGDTSTNSGKLASNKRKRAVGHTGITRTPRKEMKCDHCARRFFNAVEYALHVETHAKGITAEAESAAATDSALEQNGDGMLHLDDAKQILQKLAFVRNRPARK